MKSYTDMSINERIRYLRKELLRMSQAAFAEKIKVKQTTVSFLEKEGSTITPQNSEFICNSFGVSKLWLETGNGEPFDSLPSLDEDAEIVEELLNNRDDEFFNAIRAIMRVYSRMDPLSKKVFKQGAKDWLEEMKKEQD